MPPDGLLRYLTAAYAAPNDAVTDAALLARCAAGKDDAAFELLMRRHAELVWRVCRAVTRDHHAAEDAFQAAFLALARRAGAVGRGSVAGWLYRVAYHAALKARAARGPSARIPEAIPDGTVGARPDGDELAAVLHEELGRLAEKYRLPLVLCYLEGHSQAEAARVLGWPVGTVATRVNRGRDRLRDRLTRRGVVFSVAAFTVGPALPSPLVAASARAVALGSVPPSVHALARGAVAAMTRPKKLAAASAAAVALVAGAALTLAATARPQPYADPDADPPAAANKEGEKPVEPDRRVAPGVSALVAASTDVIVAEVLETSPQKAIEGARDTVKLKVVRPLLGRLNPDDTISVYYHLLWQDEAGTVLEPRKFEKGKRYLVFLKSHAEEHKPNHFSVVYEPLDQWLWVQPDNARLVTETAFAVRLHHGDARGEWSKPVGPLQARLVVVHRLEKFEKDPDVFPILDTYLDVRNVAGGDNTVEFAPMRSAAKWQVTDGDGKPRQPVSPPGNWLPTPDWRLVLAAGESGRLKLTVSGAGLARGRSGHLEFGLGQVWEFEPKDPGPFFLSGTIAVEPTGQRGRWSGTLELPQVRLPLGEK
jgi:RNA polymerase sigma factor (sigma-70 family)